MNFRYASISLQIAALLLACGPAEAREARSEQVPNAQKLDCGLCHIDSAGDSPRNPFGTQIELMGLDGVGAIETQSVVWSQIYQLDADGDGFTNGYELGDPDGTWVPTDGDPTVNPSLPGDASSVPCGNDSVHPDEQCDGTDFAGQTCLSQGFTGGLLACTADCTLDTTGCMVAEFPDFGTPQADVGVARDMGVAQPPPTGGDMGAETPAADGGGCGGALDGPDSSFEGSLFLLLFLRPRRRS